VNENVSIAGLSKAAVLAALYNGSKPQGMGFLKFTPEPMTEEEAQNILDQRRDHRYFDYLNGRVMKVHLEGDEFNPVLYDRDNGQDAAESIINTLRATGATNPEEVERLHLENTRKAALDLKEHLYDAPTIKELGGMVMMTLTPRGVADVLGPILDEVIGEEE